MNVFYSLSSIPQRINNLKIIIPIILNQCDLLYINLVNYNYIPNFLINNKIIINNFKNVGSEIRFFNYNDIPDDTYYFTIDDDILYPSNYSETMITKMIFYKNNSVCCVHGTNIDLNKSKDFYTNREVFHFKDKLENDKNIIIPGVGTSCFYKKNIKINYYNYKINNMSDPYTACFLSKQNIQRISIQRESNWLKPLNEYNIKIYGNNPFNQIDKLINEYKEYLKKSTS